MDFCKDCGHVISRGAQRCLLCVTIQRQHRPPRSFETRRKISAGMKAAHAKGAFSSPETNCKRANSMRSAHARGDFDDPETNRKRSNSLKAAHARGAFDAPETNRKRSNSLEAAHTRGAFDGVYQSPTRPELAVAAALDACGIKHKTQYRPDGYGRIYDEFVPPNLLIEIHGTYWHGPERPKTQKRDAEKAAWAEENGYQLVVIWEHEINTLGAEALVKERIVCSV